MKASEILPIAFILLFFDASADDKVFLVHRTLSGFEFQIEPHIAELSEEEKGQEILRTFIDKPPDKTFICDSPFQIVYLHCQVGETVKTHVLDIDDFKAMRVLIPWKKEVDLKDVIWSFMVDCYDTQYRFQIDSAEIRYIESR